MLWLSYGNTDKVEAQSCKHENAECQINASGHNCCPGLDCNFWKIDKGKAKYKCEAVVVPTATPTEMPEPTQEPEPTEEPEPSVTVTQTPRVHVPGPQNPFVIPEYHAPQCSVETPKTAENPQYSKVGDAVTVYWQHDGTNIDKWSITYGKGRHDMPYGIPFIQKEARSVTLNGISWTGNVWVSICGYNTDYCESCVVFDP